MPHQRETFEFQAEARELLDLMVHSIYSNKDIFLRELISNSSDALDRLRFESVTHPELISAGTELHILIERNKAEHTLTISDNGIGMSRDEVIDLIGTIAKSGSRQFFSAMQAAREGNGAPELIGQFGVGFYSSFMVADKVTLVTRRAGEALGTRWESEGKGSYTIEEVEMPEQGTSITLHLKASDSEDAIHDYTDEWTVKGIVKKYSDFVAYPIRMSTERQEVQRDAEGKPIPDAKPNTIVEVQTLNSMKAIWLRDKEDVSEDEYHEFYKHISHDWNEPLKVIRAKIEGLLEYQLLLFIPSRAPFDLFYREGFHGVQLYVKRVFIMDNCQELMMPYLRFMRGVVDSEDLSLNISREILQQDRQVQRMRRGLVSKVLEFLKQMSESDLDAYKTFWTEFGRVFKEGVFQDQENRQAILELLRFHSTADPNAFVSLNEYVTRVPPGQDAIYYMSGDSRTEIENSPHLEAFRARGYEVLILTDPVDEIWTQSVFEFNGKRLQSVGKGMVELGTEEEKKQAQEERKEQEERHASLLAFLKQKLETYVKDVRLSSRLTTSAACLISDENDMSPQLQQLLKAANQEAPVTKRILELNPNHPLLGKLEALHAQNPDEARLSDYAELVYGLALVAEGGEPPDPSTFSKRVVDLLVQAV